MLYASMSLNFLSRLHYQLISMGSSVPDCLKVCRPFQGVCCEYYPRLSAIDFRPHQSYEKRSLRSRKRSSGTSGLFSSTVVVWHARVAVRFAVTLDPSSFATAIATSWSPASSYQCFQCQLCLEAPQLWLQQSCMTCEYGQCCFVQRPCINAQLMV
jgi:hypothetical protein